MKVINLPPDWSITQLVYICDNVSKVKINDYEKKEEFIYLDIGCINNKKNKIETIKKYKWENAPSRAKQIVRGGDILFSTVRTYLKNVAMVPEIYDGQIASTGFCVIRPKKDVLLSNYIFNLLIYDKFLENLNILQTGSSYPAVRDKDVFNQFIPLPPLPTQHRIVEKLEELFSELESGVGSLKKAKEQIGLYKQSVLKAAFSGKLVSEEMAGVGGRRSEVRGQRSVVPMVAEPGGEYGVNDLPEGRRWVKLGEVTDSLQYGTSDKASTDSSGVPVIRMGNIQDGKLDFSNLKYMSRSYSNLEKYLLKDGDVLFNRTNSAELVGKSAIYKKHHPKSIFASYLIRIKVDKEKYIPDMVNYYINSSFGKDYIRSVVSQNVGQANVNGTKLKNMPVPFIPLDQQHLIVTEIEKRFTEAEYLQKSIDEGMAKAEALRQSILKSAFEGQLVSE